MRRRSGASKNEALAFVVILGLAATVCIYLTQKPKVVEKTVVVQQDAPPPPVQEAPPPAPVEAPPPPPPVVEKPVVVVAPPPPPPECIVIEAKLRDAQIAVAKAQYALADAKKTAGDNFHQTVDYINAKSDLADKQKARDDAADQLAKDNAANNDTDHDVENMRTAALNLVAAKAKMVSLETDAATGDQNVTDKQTALNADLASVADLHKRLTAYITKAIAKGCAVAKCKIESVVIDTDTWTITVNLMPAEQNNPGAVTDAAMNQIGLVIEKVLYKSPFTWDTAKFTVYAEYQKNKVPEFQLTYLRSAVDTADFTRIDRTYFDNAALIILAQSTWLSRAVSELQGIPAPPPVVQRVYVAGGPARPVIKYTDSLTIGGYSHLGNMNHIGNVSDESIISDKIKKVLRTKGPSTKRDIARGVNLQPFVLTSYLADLIDGGEVETCGGKRAGVIRYRIRK